MKLVCLLEERSAEEVLKIILPKILSSNISIRYFSFEGKNDLKKKLQRRIQGWQGDDACFLVLMDQDGADCRIVKKELQELIRETGKAGRTWSGLPATSWRIFLGDLAAVEKGLKLKRLSEKQNTEDTGSRIDWPMRRTN